MIIDQAVQLEPAIPIQWGFTTSKEKGTPGFWMDFQFTKIGGDNGEIYMARKTWWITEGTIDYVLKDLGVLGWYGSNLAELETHDFKGPGVLVSVEGKEGQNGKMYYNVSWINPLDYTPSNKPMEKKDLNLVAAKMKGRMAAYRAKNPVAARQNNSVLPDPDPSPARRHKPTDAPAAVGVQDKGYKIGD